MFSLQNWGRKFVTLTRENDDAGHGVKLRFIAPMAICLETAKAVIVDSKREYQHWKSIAVDHNTKVTVHIVDRLTFDEHLRRKDEQERAF